MSLANDVSEVEKPLLLALMCPTPNSPWTNGANRPTETETRGPKSTGYNLASTRLEPLGMAADCAEPSFPPKSGTPPIQGRNLPSSYPSQALKLTPDDGIEAGKTS